MKGGGGMEIEEIYKVYINDVYRYLFSLSRSHHLAEDLMQETFYRAFLYLEDYENQKGEIMAFLKWHIIPLLILLGKRKK